MTVDVTNPPVMTGLANEVMTWLEGLENGAKTDVMTRGKHFYFNCDGKNHYVYEVDETRREVTRNGKPGRKKRAYVGVMSTARNNCPAESTRWEAKHACHDRRGNIKPVGEIAGHPVFVVGKR